MDFTSLENDLRSLLLERGLRKDDLLTEARIWQDLDFKADPLFSQEGFSFDPPAEGSSLPAAEGPKDLAESVRPAETFAEAIVSPATSPEQKPRCHTRIRQGDRQPIVSPATSPESKRRIRQISNGHVVSRGAIRSISALERSSAIASENALRLAEPDARLRQIMNEQVMSLVATFGNAPEEMPSTEFARTEPSTLGGRDGVALTSPSIHSRSPGNLSQASTPRPFPVRLELAQDTPDDGSLANFGALLPHKVPVPPKPLRRTSCHRLPRAPRQDVQGSSSLEELSFPAAKAGGAHEIKQESFEFEPASSIFSWEDANVNAEDSDQMMHERDDSEEKEFELEWTALPTKVCSESPRMTHRKKNKSRRMFTKKPSPSKKASAGSVDRGGVDFEGWDDKTFVLSSQPEPMSPSSPDTCAADTAAATALANLSPHKHYLSTAERVKQRKRKAACAVEEDDSKSDADWVPGQVKRQGKALKNFVASAASVDKMTAAKTKKAGSLNAKMQCNLTKFPTAKKQINKKSKKKLAVERADLKAKAIERACIVAKRQPYCERVQRLQDALEALEAQKLIKIVREKSEEARKRAKMILPFRSFTVREGAVGEFLATMAELGDTTYKPTCAQSYASLEPCIKEAFRYVAILPFNPEDGVGSWSTTGKWTFHPDYRLNRLLKARIHSAQTKARMRKGGNKIKG